MALSTWAQAVDAIRPYSFRISTPRGFGTGFLISLHHGNRLCAIATAAHVIDHAYYWEEPIRLHHETSGASVLLRREDRVIFLNETRDTAALLLKVGELELPEVKVPLAPVDSYFRVGNEMGWVGYPAIASAKLCFFSGRVSAWLADEESYLIDGVAINGVSGGPAFNLGAADVPTVIGVVSAYMPNRATGEALPGLAVVRDVTHFHDLAPRFESLDEAEGAQPQPIEPPPPSPDARASDAIAAR